MNRFAQISVAWFFVFATLGGTLGLSLHKMTCFESGKVSLSLNHDFCCALDNERIPENSVSPICCDFDQLEFKVSVFQLSYEQDFSFVADLPIIREVPEVITSDYFPFLYEKFIPPLPTGQRLALFCTYLL